MRKSLETVCRRSTKCRNRRKMLVVGRRNAGFAENHSSSVDESEKTLKIGFRPWPKSRKQQKERFGRGRKTKNGENCISATAEIEKTLKITFPTPWKQKNILKTTLPPYGKAERLMLKLNSRVYSFLNAASNAWFSVFVPIVMRRQFSQCSMCAQLCTAIP